MNSQELEVISTSFIVIGICSFIVFIAVGLFFNDNLFVMIGGILILTSFIHIKLHKYNFVKARDTVEEQDE